MNPGVRNSRKLLFLLVVISIIAAAFAFLTLLVGALQPIPLLSPIDDIPPLDITEFGTADIPDEFQVCIVDSDCIFVTDNCASCTCGSAVSSSSLSVYYETFDIACDTHEPSECPVAGCVPARTACVEGFCLLIPDYIEPAYETEE
jgi:hypothetical protein